MISSKRFFLIVALLMVIADVAFCRSVMARKEVNVNADGVLTENDRWTGDYKAMVEDRLIRFLIPYNKTFFLYLYFILIDT